MSTEATPNAAAAPAVQASPAGTLVICPTPLGNLGDMPPRALQALREAHCICCEDTRVTGRLLAALGVEGKRLERLDEEVLAARIPQILQRVQAGEAIAYCSDAGMPGVSDPGARLVAAAREAGVPVAVLPGPTAAATAYVASGFACSRFYFGGFFPRKASERTAALAQLQTLDAVAIFYESPKRTLAAVQAIAQTLPHRRVALCRELTKLHEEVLVDAAPALAHTLQQREAQSPLKGEVVLVIDAPSPAEASGRHADALHQAADAAQRLAADPACSKKDAVATLQRDFGISRNDAYRLVHGA